MANSKISDGLKDLSRSLGRLTAHEAWLELKNSEYREGDPPALVMNAEIAGDIRNETSHFVATATEIHEVLNNRAKRKLPEKKREKWRQELLRLEAEFQKLPLPKPI